MTTEKKHSAVEIIGAIAAALVIVLPLITTLVLAIQNRGAVQEVHEMVNNDRTVLLKEVADVRAMVAILTGAESDRVLAARAAELVPAPAASAAAK